MSRIYFVPDLHLDLPFPHSSTASAELFKSNQLDALSVLSALPGHKVFLGDLFDRQQVSARCLISAFKLLTRPQAYTTTILAGNHDLSKNSDVRSSLHLLKAVADDLDVVLEPVYKIIDGVGLYFIPHQLTNEKFAECLADSLSFNLTATYNVLILHANYGDLPANSYENYLNQATFNAVMERFDLAVSGHEHAYKVIISNTGKRLVYPGSVVPVDFGELDYEREILYLDTETLSLEPAELDDLAFMPEIRFRRLTAKEFLSDEFAHLHELDLIEIVGAATASEAMDISHRSMELLNSGVTACKNSTELVRSDVVIDDGGVASYAKPESWVDMAYDRLDAEGKASLKLCMSKSLGE